MDRRAHTNMYCFETDVSQGGEFFRETLFEAYRFDIYTKKLFSTKISLLGILTI